MSVWCQHLTACQVFLHHFCIWFLLCTGVFWDSSEIALLHLSWQLLLGVFDLLLYSPVLQSSSDETTWHSVVYLVPLFQCYCIIFLHLTGSCLQMWGVWVCCYLVLCLLGRLYYFWFVVGQLQVLFKMHLSQGTAAGFHNKISYMHLLLLLILSCQIVSDLLHSRSTLFYLMSAVLGIHIHLQCLERIYLNN